jgi:hypothetical protein
MSLLNRLRLSAHLDDAALAAIWTDGRPSHPHLDTCAACRVRFSEFSGWLENIRVDAITEADQHFSAERLTAQHAQIFRRLEAAERPARVIAFPRFTQPLTGRSSHASRWITAAAAAGLIIGVGVGQLMDLRHSLTMPGAPAQQARAAVTAPQPPPARTEARVVTVSATRDEAFLSELDASLSRASVPELRALDAFTPRAGDRPR